MPDNAEREEKGERRLVSHDEIAQEEERLRREAMLDKTLADSFPASDPLSNDPNPYPHDLEGAA